MLTPAQIKAHRFASAVRGMYKSDDVDSFFEDVVDSYEQVFKENADFIKKISLLADRVEAYRNDEDNIKATLLTAQRMADKMMHDANETSTAQLKEAGEKLESAESHAKAQEQLIIEEANKKSQEKLYEAEREADRIIEDAEKQAAEILNSAKKDASEQLERTKDELKAEELSLELIKKEAAAFKGDLLEKYRQHMEFIDAIPGAVYSTVMHSDSNTLAETEELNMNPVEQTETDEPELAIPVEPKEFLSVEPEITPEESEEIARDAAEEINVFEEKEPDAIQASDESIVDEDGENSEQNDEELQAETGDADEVNQIEDITETNAEVMQDTQNSEYDEDKSNAEISGLFTLRQRAMAQQQELSDSEDDTGAETPENEEYSSAVEDVEKSEEIQEDSGVAEISKEPSDFDDIGGFRVFLENLEDDDEIESAAGSSEEDEDAGEMIETVEIDKDDDDDDDDENEPQTGFKGFFRK